MDPTNANPPGATPRRRQRRYRTATAELDARLDEVLDEAGASVDRDQLFEILVSAVLLAGDGTDRLDLKITNAALKEMRNAFRIFAPWRDVPKVTIFGSARTRPDDPTYGQARAVASALAAEGWMVITGAGPGIMAAGMEGAGRARSLGVSIRLPFEQEANHVIAGDEKLVSMKYFFTRKLMLVKESRAFVSLPGGFGTLDETFELLTLVQTGKATPMPIVMLDVPGGTYWRGFRRFIADEVLPRGLVGGYDLDLFHLTDDPADAARFVCGYYANYDSMRWVGDLLVVRVQRTPDDDGLARLNARFGDLCASGHIEVRDPLAIEAQEDDRVHLGRVALRFDRRQFGRLHQFVQALNEP